MPALRQILPWRHGWNSINSDILVTLLHLLLRRGSDNIMNPQPNNSAVTELKPDVPDVVEQKVVSGANNRALRKVKRLPIGNGKWVKVCHYRKRPYVNIRDYATTANGQLYATKRGSLLKPEEWKHLKKCVKEVDQELKQTI